MRKSETCRTEPMEKESSKKIIHTQGRNLTVEHGNFHVECSFKYWGIVQKEKQGKWELSEKVEGENREQKAVID